MWVQPVSGTKVKAAGQGGIFPPGVGTHRAEVACRALSPRFWWAPRRQRTPATERESRVPLSVTLRYRPPPRPERSRCLNSGLEGNEAFSWTTPRDPLGPRRSSNTLLPLAQGRTDAAPQASSTARPQLLPPLLFPFRPLFCAIRSPPSAPTATPVGGVKAGPDGSSAPGGGRP